MSLIIAVMIWIVIAGLGFVAGIAGLVSTKRRLDGDRPGHAAAPTDDHAVAVS